jgi:hypothetical protein
VADNEIKHVVEAVHNKVSMELAELSRQGGMFTLHGLTREGYARGYQDALWDVLLALDGVRPNPEIQQARWWREK